MKAGNVRKQWLQAMTLRSKILLIFGITWFVAIAVISAVSLNGQVGLEKSRIIQGHIGNLSDVKQECDTLLEEVNIMGIQLAYDESVVSLMQDSYRYCSENEQESILLEVSRRLGENSFVANFNQPGSLYLIAPDERVYTNNYTVIREYQLDNQIIESLQEEDVPQYGYLLRQGKHSNEIQYIRRVRLNDKQDSCGLVVLNIPRNVMAACFTSYFPNHNWFLFDKKGTIITADDNYFDGTSFQDFFNIAMVSLGQSAHEVKNNSNSGFMTYLRSSNLDLFYGCYTKNREIYDSCQTIIVTVVVSAGAALLVLLYLSWYLSQRLVKPLKNLENLMNCVEQGDYTVRMNPLYDDEVARLGRHFDRMVTKTDALIKNNQAIEKKKRRYELSVLQLQINPHFLYNTLSSIIWLANENKNNEVIDITKSLAIYYRLALSSGKEIVSVNDEILHAKNYINIQQYRYQDEFSVDYEFEEAVYTKTMPKLVLQPLIENAIYHGVKTRDEPGAKIIIKGYIMGPNMIFDIADNGSVLDATALEKLNESLRSDQAIGIGTSNVNRRIILHYGEAYGLRFVRENGWTIARITFPIEVREAYDEV